MIKKYLFIAFAIISISVVSCRQDEDLSAIELKSNELRPNDLLEKRISKKSDSSSYQNKVDSAGTGITPTDPPKNGTHWKIIDSLGTSYDPNDPPKNGTHWKTKN